MLKYQIEINMQKLKSNTKPMSAGFHK